MFRRSPLGLPPRQRRIDLPCERRDLLQTLPLCVSAQRPALSVSHQLHTCAVAPHPVTLVKYAYRTPLRGTTETCSKENTCTLAVLSSLSFLMKLVRPAPAAPHSECVLTAPAAHSVSVWRLRGTRTQRKRHLGRCGRSVRKPVVLIPKQPWVSMSGDWRSEHAILHNARSSLRCFDVLALTNLAMPVSFFKADLALSCDLSPSPGD